MKKYITFSFTSGLTPDAANYKELKDICDRQDALLDHISSPEFFTEVMLDACHAAKAAEKDSDDFSFSRHMLNIVIELALPLDIDRKRVQPEFVSSMPLFATAFYHGVSRLSAAIDRLKASEDIYDKSGKLNMPGLYSFVSGSPLFEDPNISALQALGKSRNDARKTPLKENSRRNVLKKLFDIDGISSEDAGLFLCKAFSIAANLRSSGLLPEGLAGPHPLLLPIVYPEINKPHVFREMEKGFSKFYTARNLIEFVPGSDAGFFSEYILGSVMVSRKPDKKMEISDAPGLITLALATLESGGVMKKVDSIYDTWLTAEQEKGMPVSSRVRFTNAQAVRDAREFMKEDAVRDARDFMKEDQVDKVWSAKSVFVNESVPSRVAPVILDCLDTFKPGEKDFFSIDDNGRTVPGESLEAAVCGMARDMLHEYFHDMGEFAGKALDAIYAKSDEDSEGCGPTA